MRIYSGLSFVLAFGLMTAARAEDPKPAKFGGAFDVKAFTGENKGKTLCYV